MATQSDAQTKRLQVLEFLARYQVATPEMLDFAIFEKNQDSRKNQIRALRKNTEIESVDLGIGKKVYYQLTAKGAKIVGAADSYSKPITGAQTLIRQLGTASFCSLKPNRIRINTKEAELHFPEFAEHLDLAQKPVYLEFSDDTPRIGRIIVEYANTKSENLISNCEREIESLRKQSGLRELILDGLFVFAIVVGESSKSQSISDIVKRKPLLPTWVRIEPHNVVSDLIMQAL